jgi:hypothetical protein
MRWRTAQKRFRKRILQLQEETTVPSMLIWLPLQPGQAEAARALAAECIGPRYAEYDASERRIGLQAENWYLQHTPAGDTFVIVIEGPDLNASVGAFVASQDPFDVWFKRRMLCSR